MPASFTDILILYMLQGFANNINSFKNTYFPVREKLLSKLNIHENTGKIRNYYSLTTINETDTNRKENFVYLLPVLDTK